MTDKIFRPRWVTGTRLENYYPVIGGRTRRYELLNAGLIKAKRLGKHTLFDCNSIDEYIASLPDYTKAA